MTGVATWWRGARPRTLGAGLIPVLVGAAERVGPPRLTQTGAATPRAVLVAALASIAVAGFAGLALALATSPVMILIVGAIAIVAALLYSGGPRPYAGLGLGEVMVFVFFGLVATCGTSYVMVETVPASAWWCGACVGLLAVAILEANNIRDITTDAVGGKRTLAVRIGDPAARNLYVVLIVVAFATLPIGAFVYLLSHSVGMTPWGLVGLAGWFLAIAPIEASRRATGPALVPVLVGTAKLHAVTGALITLGLVLATTVS